MRIQKSNGSTFTDNAQLRFRKVDHFSRAQMYLHAYSVQSNNVHVRFYCYSHGIKIIEWKRFESLENRVNRLRSSVIRPEQMTAMRLLKIESLWQISRRLYSLIDRSRTLQFSISFFHFAVARNDITKITHRNRSSLHPIRDTVPIVRASSFEETPTFYRDLDLWMITRADDTFSCFGDNYR